ncbi:MAG: hypothetical protein IH987_16730 [Planctomycetes bacterium]|nr:hypothetical protein [Planctomycetota bacterium]
MRNRTLLPSLLVLVLAAPGFAQNRRDARTDPASVARRCVSRSHVIADHTVHRIAARTHRCIRVINGLLAEGSVDQARQTARRCIAGNDKTARLGATRVERLVTACLGILAELEAPEELIHAVQRAGEAAHTAIRSAVNRATQAIEELLSD